MANVKFQYSQQHLFFQDPNGKSFAVETGKETGDQSGHGTNTEFPPSSITNIESRFFNFFGDPKKQLRYTTTLTDALMKELILGDSQAFQRLLFMMKQNLSPVMQKTLKHLIESANNGNVHAQQFMYQLIHQGGNNLHTVYEMLKEICNTLEPTWLKQFKQQHQPAEPTLRPYRTPTLRPF